MHFAKLFCFNCKFFFEDWKLAAHADLFKLALFFVKLLLACFTIKLPQFELKNREYM